MGASRSVFRFAGIGVAAMMALALFVVGCGEDEDVDMDESREIEGGTGMLLGEEIRASAMLDENGAVEEVRFFLPMSVVENAPEAEFDPTVPPPTDTSEMSTILTLPADVTDTTFVNHVSVEYNPAGHPPMDIYTRPHFDFHYYAIPPDEVAAIDCTDEEPVDEMRVPPNHAVAQPGLPPDGDCVPGMGLHAIDLTSPEMNPDNPETFTKTMILGYHGGRQHFVEPMISKELLMGRESFTIPIPKATELGWATRYPTTFAATFDTDKDGYVIVLRDFVEAQ